MGEGARLVRRSFGEGGRAGEGSGVGVGEGARLVRRSLGEGGRAGEGAFDAGCGVAAPGSSVVEMNRCG